MREYGLKAVGLTGSTSINLREIYGTSDETKPTLGVGFGSTFTEVDTGDVYMFNETAVEWVFQFSLQD